MVRGGGICSGRCCGFPPPPSPLPSDFFLSAGSRRRGEPALSLPPTLAMPGHFCRLETFPPRGHPRPSPSWAAGNTDGFRALDPGACPLPMAGQALPSSLPPPSQTQRGNSGPLGRPRPSPVAPSRAWRGGRGVVRGEIQLRGRGLALLVVVAPRLQCRALAKRPGTRRTGRGGGPAGWRSRGSGR